MSTSSPRRGLWITLGAVCIVGGLVAAVLLWSGATQRRTTAIENFARAPVGCDTTLDFVEPGEYLLFVETAGNLDGVRGDCDVEGAYDNDDGQIPDIEITLVDPDGNAIDLDRSFGDVVYDADGFRGVALQSVEIEEADDHVLRAESDVDGVVVIAVGRDPGEGVAVLRAASIAAALIGVLAGLVLVLRGARRSSATVPAGPWTPGPANRPGGFVPGAPAPQGPPVFGQPSGPPQYGQAPPSSWQPPPQQGPAQQGPAQWRPEPPPRPSQPPAPQYPRQGPERWDDRTAPTLQPAPGSPLAPANPTERERPSDWAPQPPPPTAPPGADPESQRERRRTHDRPPPPPPE